MSAVVIATLVVTALLLITVAGFLIWVVGILRNIDRSLAGTTTNIRRVGDRTRPLNSALRDVNRDLQAVADVLEGLITSSATPPPGRAS